MKPEMNLHGAADNLAQVAADFNGNLGKQGVPAVQACYDTAQMALRIFICLAMAAVSAAVDLRRIASALEDRKSADS